MNKQKLVNIIKNKTYTDYGMYQIQFRYDLETGVSSILFHFNKDIKFVEEFFNLLEIDISAYTNLIVEKNMKSIVVGAGLDTIFKIYWEENTEFYGMNISKSDTSKVEVKKYTNDGTSIFKVVDGMINSVYTPIKYYSAFPGIIFNSYGKMAYLSDKNIVYVLIAEFIFDELLPDIITQIYKSNI